MNDSTCSVTGCIKPKKTKLYCGMHYARNRRNGTPGPAEMLNNPADATLAERFAKFGWTVTPSGCWEWNGSKFLTGYGHLMFEGRDDYTHRLSYRHHIGPIPESMFVCHACDNPPCMNPAHLFLGTPGDNARDMFTKGRQTRKRASGEAASKSKLTVDIVREIRDGYHGLNQKELAEKYGVDRNTIGRVAARQTWKHVE